MTTTSARKISEDALAEARRRLKALGYRAKGRVFFKQLPGGNLGIIEFQKSRDSNDEQIKVTVNYGVFSSRVGELYDGIPEPRDALDAHWSARVKGSDGIERWHVILPGDQVRRHAASLWADVQAADSEIGRLGDDHALVNEYLARRGGRTELQRQLSLVWLVSRIGPAEKLPELVANARRDFAGTPHERLVEFELKKAGVL